jgi:four helix bundle protein
MTIKTYEDLEVYKKSLKLLELIYDVAYKIPHLSLRTQIIRSAESIPPLIAEGFAKKRNPKEAGRFYEMAMTESDEVCVHLVKATILSKRFTLIPTTQCSNLKSEYKILAKQLNKLSATWRGFSSNSKPVNRKTEIRNLKTD